MRFADSAIAGRNDIGALLSELDDILLTDDQRALTIAVAILGREADHDMTEPLVEPGQNRALYTAAWRKMADVLLAKFSHEILVKGGVINDRAF
jgi:hypothetical protein